MHITFICTGNTCRSPMAEGIAKRILAEKYDNSGITVSSAGVSASNGTPPNENAVIACNEIGIDISEHRSHSLSREILDLTDVFVVMTKTHADILGFYDVPNEKIVVLGGGIPDPFGRNVEIYRRCRDAIVSAANDLLADLVKRMNNPTDDTEKIDTYE